ncbi:MAG TPA: hypothetical protein VGJ37_17600 [Pyrinomonadaceae bacterium]|jgi:hypothetical protein
MKTLALILVISTAGWQTVDFNGLFSFRLPEGFVRSSALGPDEVRAEYQKNGTKLIVVWGHTESATYKDRKQDWMSDYQESTTRIRGQRANIRTYWQTVNSKRSYRAELNVGNWEKGEVQIYMRMETGEPTMLPIADQIFKSINLPLPSPERRPSNP